MHGLKGALVRVLGLVVTPLGAVWVLVGALVARARRRPAGRARVVWGPLPLRNYKYNAAALRARGYASESFVDGMYAINRRKDFDRHYDDLAPERPRWLNAIHRNVWAPYAAFAHVLRTADVVVTTFDGGFLRGTRLRFLEAQLLHLAQKRLVVWPYGSDSTVYARMLDLSFRHALQASYPRDAARDREIERQLAYFSRHADFVVGNMPHAECCPRLDVVTVACYGIDTAEWAPDAAFRHTRDGSGEPVIVVHAPNHRRVKGTEFIQAACEALRCEGLAVELRILERVPNEVVRRAMRDCDIVAAQLLYGYAATEVEGMCLAKPVISNLTNDAYFAVARRSSQLGECPVVSTTPERVLDDLRRLVTSPELRAELGQRGREYVLRYHSLAAQGLFWSRIVERAAGRGGAVADWWRERQGLSRDELDGEV